jgi:hypothetical protein
LIWKTAKKQEAVSFLYIFLIRKNYNCLFLVAVYSNDAIKYCKKTTIDNVAPVEDVQKPVDVKAEASKQKAPEKAAKKKDEPKKGAAAKPEDDVVDVGRLDLRVGRIVHVEKHP